MTLRFARSFALPMLCALPLAAGSTAAAGAADFRFEKLNRTYSDFAPPIQEIDEGGVRAKLRSPKQALVLRDHRVRLEPAGEGLFRGEVELDVQGKGTLIADVDFGPMSETFTEDVIVPPQKLTLTGKVQMRRVEGGYEIRGIELPQSMQVAIQSATINSILGLCDQAAILSLGSIDCSGVEAALTRPRLPIPSGQPFTLQDGDLTPEDRAALDALLAAR